MRRSWLFATRLRLAAVAAAALLGVSSSPPASSARDVAGVAAEAPSLAGTWLMVQKGTCCTTSLTYTITQTGPGTYPFSNGVGEETTDVTVSGSASSASATTFWCGYSTPACSKATGYAATFEVKYVFDLASCPATVTYSWTQPFDKDNPYTGTGHGTRACTGGSLSVGLSVAKPRLAIGATTVVDAVVTAQGGDVKGISLGDGLRISPSLAVVTRSPAGLNGFDLADGQSKSFTFTLSGTKSGRANLSLEATGTGPSGAVTGSGRASLQIGVFALVVSLSATPTHVDAARSLEAGGRVPVNVTVKVSLANTSKSPLDGVELLSLDVVPVDRTQALPKLAFPTGSLPVQLGTLAPGANVSKTFRLDASKGDGNYQVEALALYEDASKTGGNGRGFGVGGRFEVATIVLDSTLERAGA